MTGGPSNGELILTEDGRAAIRLRAVGGTIWLTQAEIAVCRTINLHLKNTLENDELDQGSSQGIFDNCRQR